MDSTGDPTVLEGRAVLDRHGHKIGKIEEVLVDEETGERWATVGIGPLGMRSSLVPLRGARRLAEAVRVPYDKTLVRHAPDAAVDHGDLSPVAGRALLDHYGIEETPEHSHADAHAHLRRRSGGRA